MLHRTRGTSRPSRPPPRRHPPHPDLKWPHSRTYSRNVSFENWGISYMDNFQTHALMSRTSSAIAALLMSFSLAWAEDAAPFERRVSLQFRAISSELLENIDTVDIKILAPSAVSGFGQINLPINEHFYQFDSLEAETIKADGTRLKVEPDKILLSALPNAAQMGIFNADTKTRTIIFPDVAVGDTLHYVYKSHSLTASVPGGFANMRWIPANGRFSEFKVSLDVPQDLAINVSRQNWSETQSTQDGRRNYLWKVEPQAFRTDEPSEISLLDRTPYLIFTSFQNYESVVRWWHDVAAPKALPTAEIRALADKITTGLSDRRAQARAIHDWVSVNIRYFAVFNGRGGYVPHAATEVLTAKFGDCKDHAALTHALLAAKGIDVEYVYLNAGNWTYSDFGDNFPVTDHVILYLPEFDLYTDSTSNIAAFGVLPATEAGKLAYRVGPKGMNKVRLPLAKSTDNVLKLQLDVTLRPDGTPTGTAIWSATGEQAANLRARMQWAESNGLEQGAVTLLKQANWRGSGRIEPHAATDHAEPYVVKTTFDLQNVYFGKGDNTNPIPIGPSLQARPYESLVTYVDQGRSEVAVWRADTYEANIDVRLPDGYRLAKTPQNIAVKAGAASYTAKYAVSGQVLHIERRWVLDLDKPQVTKAEIEAIVPAARAARADGGLRLRIVASTAPSVKAE